MDNKRWRQRVDYKNPCILTHEGISYLGMLVNFSPSGAFVKVANGQTDRILCLGDTVVLKLCINPASCPAEYYGTVIRLETSGLGVTFEKVQT